MIWTGTATAAHETTPYMPNATAPRPSSMVLVQSLIGSGHGLSHFYQLALPPLFPLIQAEFGTSYAALGLLLTLFAATTGGFQIVAGFLVDRIGARLLLVSGLALSAAGIGAIGFVDSYWAMAALVVVAGVGNAVFHPADYVILNASVPRERLGRAFSVHTFTGNVGFAAAPATMILLTSLFGWRAALMIVASFALVVMGFVLAFGHVLQERIDRRKPAGQAETGKTGWRLLLSLPITAMFAFFVASALASSGIQSFLVTALVEAQGLDLGSANFILTASLVAGAGGVLIGGQIADRTTRHGPVVSAALLASAALAVSVGLLPLPAAVLFVIFVAIGVLTGATRSSRDIMVRQITPERDVGKVFAYVSTGLNVGGAIAPFAFGLLLDYGQPTLIFVALAGFFLLGIATLGTSRMYAKPAGVAGAAAD